MPSPRLPELLALLVFGGGVAAALAEAPTKEPPGRAVAGRTIFEESLVEISRACPGVVVELRYATDRNVTGKPIYPPSARAMLRRSVAERLNKAQTFLQDRGYCLKVWDAYRPASVQRLLWEAIRNPAYVVEPSATGSLHGWGAAVDVTLVDFRGREVKMPTDFDSFSEAARYDYKGGDADVAYNLTTLQRAMADAGFRHIRDEWWHYSVSDLHGFGPIDMPLTEGETKVAEAKPPEPKPVEVKRVALKPVDPKPPEVKPVEPKPVAPKPVEVKRVAMRPVVAKPEVRAEDDEPDEPQPAPKKMPEPKTVEIKRKVLRVAVADVSKKKNAPKKPAPEDKSRRVKRPLFPPRAGETP